MTPEVALAGLTALAGLAIGLTIGWLAARARVSAEHSETVARAAELHTRLDERSSRVAALEDALRSAGTGTEQVRAELAQARERHARLDTELARERTVAGEKLAILSEAERTLRESFQALSAAALKSNSESFLQLARESLGQFQQHAVTDLEGRKQAIDELVKPLHETLQQVTTNLHQVEKDRVGAYVALHAQVKSLADTQRQLEGETASLVRALRTPHVRGQWGEVQLRRVVEMAGMVAHCDFREQQTAESEDGRFRPDVVVQLPGGKFMVVDAKVPLQAYLEALEQGDDALRDARLADHARQVRDHVTRLSGKSYWEQFQPAPECVVMFLPGETFFSAALQHDPSLFEFAATRRVVVASPMTLIALLYAVAKGWQQEQIAENAQRISILGQELYKRLRVFAGYFEDLRKGLDNATAAYNRAVGSMESRVLVTARKFRELGAAPKEEIPDLEMVERAARELQVDQLELLPDDDDDLDPLSMPAAASGSKET